MSDRQPPEHVSVHLPGAGPFARLRNYFLTGLVIAAPVAITLWLTWTIVEWVDAWIQPLIPQRYWPDTYLPFAIPGFGLVVVFVAVTLLGFLTANLVGRRLIRYGEALVDRMPFVRAVYSALKQIFETVVTSRQKSFQKVCLIEYPRPGLWSLAFIAQETRGEIRLKVAEEGADEILSVYVPTTPNPTSGYLLFVHTRELRMLDMTLEEAAKLLISGGLVEPEYPSVPRARRKAKDVLPAPEPETVNQP